MTDVYRALGVDVNTRRIALAALTPPGYEPSLTAPLTIEVVNLNPRATGARRLVDARMKVAGKTRRIFSDTCVAVIEVPRFGEELDAIAYVCEEAVQATCSGAIVLRKSAPEWKKVSVGKGNADKPAYIAHAQTLGLIGDDEDCAAATCMAQAAWYFWRRDVDREAA